MSYLPRMSKTYKEPEERTEEEVAKEITFNSIPIASAQLDQKSYNPQSVLKHYRYFPHPPPVLPGPSLINEAEENEKISIEARRRRTRDESETNISTLQTENTEENPFESNNQYPTINFALLDLKSEKINEEKSIPNSSWKGNKSNRTPRKGNLKVQKNKEETTKRMKLPNPSEEATNESNSHKIYNKEHSPSKNEIFNSVNQKPVKHHTNYVNNIKFDENVLNDPREDVTLPTIPVKDSIHEGVQCSMTSRSEKVIVMPSCIHFLLKTFSFLVQELSRKETEGQPEMTKETKKLITQINEAINSLTNRKIDNLVALLTSISDQKRLQKIYSDLEQYIQDVYGENGKLGYMLQEKKRLYCRLLQKDYELDVLNEKLRDSEIQNPCLEQIDITMKPAEVVFQNKTLENEQLQAEVEFLAREIKKCHQTLAEKNWEIYNYKEEISEFKKKLATLKSKNSKK